MERLQLLHDYDPSLSERSQEAHTHHSPRSMACWDSEEAAMTQMSIAQDAETHTKMNLSVCKCQAHTNVIMKLSKNLKPEILLRKMVKFIPS